MQRGGEPPSGRRGHEGTVALLPEGERAPVGDDDDPAHAALTSGAGRDAAGDPLERGPQHVDRLGAQLVQGPVAVDAFAQVDLGQALGPQALGHVDEQPQLDAVAPGEAELLEDPAVGRRLAGQRLAHPGELGEEQLEHGAGHQLGDPAAAGGLAVQGAGVEALDQGHVVGGQQRPEQPGDECRGRVGHVGVEEDDEVARRRRRGPRPWPGPCPRRPAGPRHHPCPGVGGVGGRVVARPVVEHDHLVDQAVAPVLGQERLDHRPHDRSHRRGLVAGRDAHRHGPLRAHLGRQDPLGREVPVLIGAHHAPDSSSRAALSGPQAQALPWWPSSRAAEGRAR